MTQIFDIAVIGGGPAGANAALAGDEKGLQVILIDEGPAAGGQVWRAKSDAIISAPASIESRAGDQLREKLARSTITKKFNACVWQIERLGDGWCIYCVRADVVETINAKTMILAIGAREYVQPIPGWTIPGVVGLAGATALMKRDQIPPGKHTIVAGAGPLVFFVASEIRRLGGNVAAVITHNTKKDWLHALPDMVRQPALMQRGLTWIADLMLSHVPILWGDRISKIHGTDKVQSIEVRGLTLTCDSVCLGNTLVPNIDAAMLAGVKIEYSPQSGGWIPKADRDGTTAIFGVYICGDGAGILGVQAAEIHGRLVGLRVAQFLGQDTQIMFDALRAKYDRSLRFGKAMTRLSHVHTNIEHASDDDTIFCRCEGVTRAMITKEIAQGAHTLDALKSALRTGMGPCGGKYCQTAVAHLLSAQTNTPMQDLAPPSIRPPLRPVSISALGGDFAYADLPILKPAPL